MTVIYLPESEQDLKEIFEWYEEQQEGLGETFLMAVGGMTNHLRSYPERWRVVVGNTRKALMRRFPYSVYYNLKDEETILIVAIIHEKRHPDYVIKRLLAEE